MAVQKRRCLFVNWKALEGSTYGKRKLVLRKNNHEMYTCLIKLCLHTDFKSSRGLRKHIDNKHPWYYYFEEQPEIKREELENKQPPMKKACTSRKPAFSLEKGVGSEFLKWLCTSCGGGKTQKEAHQIGKRVMKFLMEALGSNECENELNYEYVDCCLSSASVFIAFIQTLEEEWKLSSSASLNYIKAIGDMVDFRKSNGVSDNTLRCFTVMEVYLRRAKENLRKKKNLECNRNLDLETLIAKDSWATIEDMEEVIPFHANLFKSILEKCKLEDTFVSKSELVFCTRFVTTLLFLRVKCSRPMTYQYLTVSMVQKAKENDGFIEQTEFKTAAKYIFDTLIITDDVMYGLDQYIDNIRPLLNPRCDFLLLSTNGTQFQSLTTAMTMLVHQAIGKYINPTRYRQIVETESSERLTREEQEFVSEDQKHSSKVAKIFYKKKQSRKVAIEGKKCMDKMTQAIRSEPRQDMMELLNSDLNLLDQQFDKSVLSKSKALIEQGECSGYKPNFINLSDRDEGNACDVIENEIKNPYEPDDNDSITDLKIVNCNIPNSNETKVLNEDVEIKKEIVNLVVNKGKNTKFSQEEDTFLKAGIKKYGKAWASILKDSSLKFHSSRTRDTLRMRAETITFKRYCKKDD